MEKLNKLYEVWLNEQNKGHYKEDIVNEKNVLNLFANQNYIVKELDNLFKHYKIDFKGTILDVGCSMGGMLFSLYNSKKFDFIAGVDIDKTAVEMAKEYKNMNKVTDDELYIDTCDIYDLPFEDNSFDFIIMKDVGEHLENEENLLKSLRELKRVIKNDGYIFIETPNYLFPLEVHLKIPMLPYLSTKLLTKCIAKLFKKDPKFVDHLNFTTPKMFERIFKYLNVNYYSAYEEYKIPYIISNPENLSPRFKFLRSLFMLINKYSLSKYIVNIFKISKMYPSLWYIVEKK
ncbi:class I SAM-dependent methyltransferase [Arcobacter sp. YIC-310]|uniref:class I SAM-dependent methyltransferase n=1 Tax=Arcobacter sp. YIC-310 TaxID=3376632 RepID=UPI003C23B9DF